MYCIFNGVVYKYIESIVKNFFYVIIRVCEFFFLNFNLRVDFEIV